MCLRCVILIREAQNCNSWEMTVTTIIWLRYMYVWAVQSLVSGTYGSDSHKRTFAHQMKHSSNYFPQSFCMFESKPYHLHGIHYIPVIPNIIDCITLKKNVHVIYRISISPRTCCLFCYLKEASMFYNMLKWMKVLQKLFQLSNFNPRWWLKQLYD